MTYKPTYIIQYSWKHAESNLGEGRTAWEVKSINFSSKLNLLPHEWIDTLMYPYLNGFSYSCIVMGEKTH